jgi:hypothetical protein
MNETRLHIGLQRDVAVRWSRTWIKTVFDSSYKCTSKKDCLHLRVYEQIGLSDAVMVHVNKTL